MNYYRTVPLWIIRISLLVIPFIPLYVSRSLFFPYITGKAFVFRALVGVAFFFWVYLMIFYHEYRPRRGPMIFAVLFFVFATVLAALFGENVAKSFWSNFERMEGVVAYIYWAAYFLVLAHMFTRRDWLLLFNVLVVAGMIENGYAVLQKLGYLASPQGGARPDGTIGNPTYLAAYLIFVAAFCVLLFIEARAVVARWLYGIGFLITIIVIFFTASRGPALALVAGGLTAGMLYVLLKRAVTPKEQWYKRIALGGVVASVVLIGTLWSLRNTAFIRGVDPQYTPPLARLTSLSFSERTITSRFTIWNMGRQGFLEKPIFGWGPDNYSLVFAKYYRPELWAQEPWFDRSHNIILDWLINGGIVGFSAYMSTLGAAFFLLWRQYQKRHFSLSLTLLLGTTLSVYFVQNLFVFDNIATYLGIFTIFAYVHAVSVRESKQSIQSMHGVSYRIYQPIALIVALVFSAVVFVFVVALPLRTNLNLLEALRAQGQGVEMSFENFDRALRGGFLGRTEAREQFVQFAIGVGGSGASADVKDRVLRRAIEEAKKNVEENKQDPRAYLFLGGLYARLNATDVSSQNNLFDLALASLNDALRLSPKKQQIYFEIADVYLKKGSFSDAIHALESAYQLDTKFPAAQTNLALVYIITGQQQKADELLLKERGSIDVRDTALIQAYSRLVDETRANNDRARLSFYTDRLARTWRLFIEDTPDNFEYRKRLALLYLIVGDGQKANEVLQEAIQYKSEFQKDVQEFILQAQNGTIQ